MVRGKSAAESLAGRRAPRTALLAALWIKLLFADNVTIHPAPQIGRHPCVACCASGDLCHVGERSERVAERGKCILFVAPLWQRVIDKRRPVRQFRNPPHHASRKVMPVVPHKNVVPQAAICGGKRVHGDLWFKNRAMRLIGTGSSIRACEQGISTTCMVEVVYCAQSNNVLTSILVGSSAARKSKIGARHLESRCCWASE